MNITDLKILAGLSNRATLSPYSVDTDENISYTAKEKSDYQRKHRVKPGTDEWFKLWFARPHLTGEKPFNKK